jgi:hypothetical protein
VRSWAFSSKITPAPVRQAGRVSAPGPVQQTGVLADSVMSGGAADYDSHGETSQVARPTSKTFTSEGAAPCARKRSPF